MELEKITLKQLLKLLLSLDLKSTLTFYAILIMIISLPLFFMKRSFEAKLFEKNQEIEAFKAKWSEIKPFISYNKNYDLRNNIISLYNDNIPKDSELINKEVVAQKNIEGPSTIQAKNGLFYGRNIRNH